jgi:hypothetical protein
LALLSLASLLLRGAGNWNRSACYHSTLKLTFILCLLGTVR